MEHEDGALLGGEASKPTFKEVAIAHAQQLVRGRRSVDRQHPQVRRPTALARRLGDADVDEEALEPGIEPIRIAEAAKVTPGDHQRVLQGVLGPIDVTEDPLGDREETVGSDADQVDIRVPIPALCRPHEIVVHGAPRLDGLARLGELQHYWSVRGARRSFFARFHGASRSDRDTGPMTAPNAPARLAR